MTNFAFVFPGQGSQNIGMLSELAEQYPIIQESFAQVSNRLGYDVWQLTQEGPEEKLNQTEITQVVMLTADVAVFKLLQKNTSVKPQMMAGHSLGEYAALVCAGAIELADAAHLVARRGQLMQKHVPLGQGAMAAIVGLSDEQVKSLCQQASNSEFQVMPANYNAIGQVVIAGHTVAVEEAIKLAEDMGARLAKIIPVSVPCHCPLLEKAAAAFEEDLAKANFQKPEFDVISNVNLSVYQSPQEIRALLKEQLYRPVRWVETIQLMKQKGIDHVIECGPGKVLSGLVKRIDKNLSAMSVNDVSSFQQAVTQLI
nr:ACP S-malonyltransferase [Legionella jordanis]